jgi:predicted naringenin-chalcone synthase
MLERSGVGPQTAWPPGINKSLLRGEPADESVDAARKETEVVVFDCVRALLEKTGTKAKDIDILVVNCSLFSPTPSICAMIINEFELRSDISSYNLSGMGCSAGLISIELVRNLMAGRPMCRALVVSTENLTQALYHGNDKSFLLQNTLFRCGGAAVLLSNRWLDGHLAMLKLLHVERTQYVTKDSYSCVWQAEDDSPERNQGVRLSKDIVKVAGRALEKNLTMMGPYVLPLSEQLVTGFWMLVGFLSKKVRGVKIKPYIPDLKTGVDHFCIHAGGRGVIDGIEKNLNLTPRHVEASRHALCAYGNTSSSSIWYEMDYVRNHMDLAQGQRVLQIAFGSGFKCNSAFWLCIRTKKTKGQQKMQKAGFTSHITAPAAQVASASTDKNLKSE